jgi:hypothetical protein
MAPTFVTLAVGLLALDANASPVRRGNPFPSNVGYAKAKCASTDISHAVDQIRSDVEAVDAWNFVKDRWNQGPNRPNGANLNFTAYFSHQFNGPQQWNCDTFGDLSNCDQTLGGCGDQFGKSGDVDTPAAYEILNCFV